jgi:hypothetical protein
MPLNEQNGSYLLQNKPIKKAGLKTCFNILPLYYHNSIIQTKATEGSVQQSLHGLAYSHHEGLVVMGWFSSF